MKRIALDWFEASLEGSDEACNTFAMLLLKTLGMQPGSASRFYQKSMESSGVTLQYEPKPKTNCKRLYLRMTGKFFQQPQAEEGFNSLIHVLMAHKIAIFPTRIDAAVDLISNLADGFEPIPIPVALKATTVVKEISSDGATETYFSGKSDFRLRVYNKLLECPEYEDLYGFDCLIWEVWRVESQIRGKMLSNLLNHKMYANFAPLYQDYILMSLGQVGRRFAIEGLYLPKNGVSTYVRTDATYENQVKYAMHKLKSAQARLNELEIETDEDVIRLYNQELYRKLQEKENYGN